MRQLPKISTRLKRIAVVIGILALTGLVGATGGPSAQQPSAQKPTYGAWGVDLTGMDKSVKPGDDFFDYVNGTWYKNAVIPPDRLGIGSSLDTRATLLEEQGVYLPLRDMVTIYRVRRAVPVVRPLITNKQKLRELRARKTVQAQLGHSDASITLETYSHIVEKSQRAAVEQMARILMPNDAKSGVSTEWTQ